LVLNNENTWNVTFRVQDYHFMIIQSTTGQEKNGDTRYTVIVVIGKEECQEILAAVEQVEKGWE